MATKAKRKTASGALHKARFSGESRGYRAAHGLVPEGRVWNRGGVGNRRSVTRLASPGRGGLILEEIIDSIFSWMV